MWDSGQSLLTNLCNLPWGNTATSTFQWTSLFTRHIPRENVRVIHWHDLCHCLSRWNTCTLVSLMITYNNLEMFSNDSITTTFKSMPKNQASVHWRLNT
jgi:hypothetical protein